MIPASPEQFAVAVRDVASQLEAHDPQFRFTIGWSDTYDSLFSTCERTRTGIEHLQVAARKHGRVVLHAEGGSGKTTILARVFRQIIDQGNLAVLVDLRRWRPDLFEKWNSYGRNEVGQARVLLSDICVPQVVEDALPVLVGDHSLFVLIDGLNEVPSHVAQGVLDSMDALARRQPFASVIITDRLVRRELRGEQWQRATIERLDHEEVSRVLSNHQMPRSPGDLLGTAFFLDLALKQGLDSTSGSATFDAYFRHHVGFTEQQIDSMADVAFQAYSARQSRTFDHSWFEDRLPGSMSRLVESGTVVCRNDRAFFKHQLFHDYLVSKWLMRKPDQWTSEVFDTVTFHASSFEVLALTLEQLSNHQAADEFVRRIYDWSFYGSAYAVARAQLLGVDSVSHDMELVLLAVLAERRWDLLRSTAQRVTDALRLFPSDQARRVLATSALSEVIEIVENADVESPEFRSWREVFTIPNDAAVSDDVPRLIREPDSIRGWTAANVLKRVQLTEKQVGWLRSVFRSDPLPTIRWRAVHALGAYPSPDTVDALFLALGDDDHWVRYGAIRSLIECAARESTVRRDVFQRLRDRIGAIARDEDERTISEFEKAVLLRTPPPDWIDNVEPVLEELWATAGTLEEQDHWRRLAYEVQQTASETQ